MTVYVPIEKKLDRQLDTCRRGAIKDRCTVYLVRKPRHHGTTPTDPKTWTRVIEITPDGDVRECPAAGLHTSLRDHMIAAGLGGFVATADAAITAHKAKRQAKRDHFRKLAADKRKAIQAAYGGARAPGKPSMQGAA